MCRAHQIAELHTALTSNVQIEEAKNQEGCNGLLSNISAATLKICNYHVRVLQLEIFVNAPEFP